MRSFAFRAAPRRVLFAAWALCSCTGALALALHHPLSPTWAVTGVAAGIALVFVRPDIWLFVLPAALPWASFSPWSGWLIFDEFDLLVFSAAAGAYLRASTRTPPAGTGAAPRAADICMSLLAVPWCVGLLRGLSDAGPAGFGWFDGYADPLNTLHVAKSLGFALLLWPAVCDQAERSAERAFRCLAAGMLVGLGVTVLAIVSERQAYPGLFDFKARYRTTAWFWEMHVGGAALDGYLALATPFVAWALYAARTPARWSVAALLALLTAYACLTTFSRGVYLGVGAPLALIALALWERKRDPAARAAWRRGLIFGAAALLLAVVLVVAFEAYGYAGPGTVLLALMPLLLTQRARNVGWRTAGSRALSLLLMLEIAAVLGTGSFMNARLAASDHDFDQRAQHWRNGLNLLHGPADWLLGLGWGRFPGHYARETGREFSGATHWIRPAPGQAAVRISGPESTRRIAGLYSLTQTIAIEHGDGLSASFDIRAPQAVDLVVSVCEMHLIYERQCAVAVLLQFSSPSNFAHLSLPLIGPKLSPGTWYAPHGGVFALTVAQAGVYADITNVSLRHADNTQLLRNGDFSQGLAHWFPSAQGYFVPWHIDNLYLEWLIENGLLGLLAFAGLAATALSTRARKHDFAPFLAASICGAMLVGLLSSLMDVPRVAFLLLLLTFFSVALRGTRVPGAAPHE